MTTFDKKINKKDLSTSFISIRVQLISSEQDWSEQDGRAIQSPKEERLIDLTVPQNYCEDDLYPILKAANLDPEKWVIWNHYVPAYNESIF